MNVTGRPASQLAGAWLKSPTYILPTTSLHLCPVPTCCFSPWFSRQVLSKMTSCYMQNCVACPFLLIGTQSFPELGGPEVQGLSYHHVLGLLCSATFQPGLLEQLGFGEGVSESLLKFRPTVSTPDPSTLLPLQREGCEYSEAEESHLFNISGGKTRPFLCMAWTPNPHQTCRGTLDPSRSGAGRREERERGRGGGW